MNYWIRLKRWNISTLDIFFENTVEDWKRLQAALKFGYTIETVEPEE
jgi:hypothetical protein